MKKILTVEDITHRFPYLLDLDYRAIDLESELEKLGYIIAGHDYVSYEYADIVGYYSFELEKI